ncbi:MAG TPA: hypothetical protein DCQ31_16480, partial [Bacteroidales bacterium]|nr:hypothetical protein [Bacteroidales bacterium]
YLKLNNPEAITYLNKSLKIAEQLNDKYKIMNANESIGDFYFQEKKYKKAISAYEKALRMAQEVERQRSISDIWRKMGKAFLKLDEIDKALDFTRKSMAIAKEYNMLNEQKLLHFQLSQIDSANNNFKQAYENYKHYKAYNDSIFNEKNVKRITELEMNYKFEKEKQAIEFENQKKFVVHEAEAKMSRIIIISLIIVIMLMVWLAIILFRSYRFKHNTNLLLMQQKNEIEELNDEYLTVNEELKQTNEQLNATKLQVEERENLLIQITDNVPVFIALLDADLKYRFVNKRYAENFNFSRKKIIGKKVADVLDTQSCSVSAAHILKPLQGETISFENKNCNKNAEQIVQTTYLPYYHGGEIQGVVVCSIDITERKKAEQLIKDSEEKLNLIIKNSNDIFVLVNEKGEQYFISDVAEKYTGYSVEELKGAINDVIFPNDVEIVQQHWNRVLLNKKNSDTIQYRHKHKEKGYVWFEAVAQNFLDNPAINSVVANIRDITERKKIEQALVESEKEKKRLLQSEIERVNSELENNQKAMTVATLKLLQNSERDAHTINQLVEIEKNTNAEGKKLISALIANYKRMSFNSNWDEFELLFEKTHLDFYDSLNAKFPTLTGNERKICAFLKLNMSSK